MLERLATSASAATVTAGFQRWGAVLRSSRATHGHQATAASGADSTAPHAATADWEAQAAAEHDVEQGARAVEAALAPALGPQTAASLVALLRSLRAREADLLRTAEHAAGRAYPAGPGQPGGGGGSAGQPLPAAAELAVGTGPALKPGSSVAAAPPTGQPSVCTPAAARLAGRAVAVSLVVDAASGRVRVQVHPASRRAGPWGLGSGPAHAAAAPKEHASHQSIATIVDSAAGLLANAEAPGGSPGEAAMGVSRKAAAAGAPGDAGAEGSEGGRGETDCDSQAAVGASGNKAAAGASQCNGTPSGGAEGCGISDADDGSACCRQGEPHADSSSGADGADGQPSTGREALLERELQEARATAAAAQAEAVALRAELQSALGSAPGSGSGLAQRQQGCVGPVAGAGEARAPPRLVSALRYRVRPCQGSSRYCTGSAQHAHMQQSMLSWYCPPR